MLLLADLDKYAEYVAKNVARISAMEARYDPSEGETEYHKMGSNAVIQVVGPLSYKSDFWTWYMGGVSYKSLCQKIAAANANADIKKIVLAFDTPGGEVTGCQMAARTIRESAKPIEAAIDSTCASAGLWLASQCTKITCVESGEIGSLGVQGVVTTVAKMLEMAGVEKTVFRSSISPDKNLGSGVEPLTDEAKEYFQARVDKWGEAFLGDVAVGRGVSREVALDKFGKGRMMFADEALEAGLIDAIGSLDSVLSDMEKPARRAIKYRD